MGAEAIGAVVPDAVVDQAAAGITAFKRLGAGFLRLRSVFDGEVLRVVADHDRVAGGGDFPVGVILDGDAGFAFGVAVGPGRIEIAIGCPGRIPRVAVAAATVGAGEIDAAELLGGPKGQSFGG